jgi:hypothetical protein
MQRLSCVAANTSAHKQMEIRAARALLSLDLPVDMKWRSKGFAVHCVLRLAAAE